MNQLKEELKNFNYPHYIKTSVMSVLLFVTSMLLGNTVVDYVEAGNYFSFPLGSSVMFVVYSTLLLVIFAMSIGCWNRYDQYLFVMLPIVFGIFFSLEHLNPIQALTLASVFALILIFLIYRAFRLKSLLVKFVPNLVFSDATRILLFMFSLMSAYAIFINFDSVAKPSSITDLLSGEVSKVISNSEGGPFEILKNANVPLDDIIKQNVEGLLAPFGQFMTPIIALIVLSYFQLLSWISYTIYSLIIEPIFWLGKRFGLYRIELEDVKRENLTF